MRTDSGWSHFDYSDYCSSALLQVGYSSAALLLVDYCSAALF